MIMPELLAAIGVGLPAAAAAWKFRHPIYRIVGFAARAEERITGDDLDGVANDSSTTEPELARVVEVQGAAIEQLSAFQTQIINRLELVERRVTEKEARIEFLERELRQARSERDAAERDAARKADELEALKRRVRELEAALAAARATDFPMED